MSGGLVALLAFATFGLIRILYHDFLSSDARTKRTLARRPRARIQGASGPTLRVTGRVRQRGEPLNAPVSGRPCVAFNLLVEEGNKEGWSTLLDVRDAHSFVVVDESGEALVDTSGPFTLALVPDGGGSSGWFGRMDSTQRQALNSMLGSRATNWLGGPKKLRYKEGILEDGERVSVGGNGVREVSPEGRRPNLRDPPARLVLRGTAEEPLLISDSLEALRDPDRG